MQTQYLTNHLLIAMPQMLDPSFEKTVTLICEHNQEGALGIVLNRPLAISISEILEQFGLNCTTHKANDFTLMGGPVAPDRGFVLHSTESENAIKCPNWESSLIVSKSLRITTSRDILEAIALGDGPQHLKFALGYAGWEAGQLEEELLSNAWLTVPCTNEIVFNTEPSECWKAAANLIGIDIETLSSQYGHA